MLLGYLIDHIFEIDDLPRVFEHVFLHLIDDDVLNCELITLSNSSLSLILVSS